MRCARDSKDTPANVLFNCCALADMTQSRQAPALDQHGAQPRVACKGLASSAVPASLVCKCDVCADPGAVVPGWARTRAARRACWRTRAPRSTRGWARTRPRSATPRGAALAATCPSCSRRVARHRLRHACFHPVAASRRAAHSRRVPGPGLFSAPCARPLQQPALTCVRCVVITQTDCAGCRPRLKPLPLLH